MLNAVSQAVFTERTECINCRSTDLTELSSGRYVDEPVQGFLAADPWGEDPLPFLRSATWSLVKCHGCSQVFHRRILNKEWNERRFSRWMSGDAINKFERSQGYTFTRNFRGGLSYIEHALRIELLTRSIRGVDAVRLLDFGCGFGHFLQSCSLLCFEAIGVDRSMGRRSKAAVEILPSLDDVTGMFHALTLFEVLEHLDDPRSILEALNLHIVSGGILFITTPDCSGVTTISTERDYRLAHPLEHINCFSHGTLKSIASRAGFDHIEHPLALATAELPRAARTLAKHLLHRDGRATQLYFRKR
ncbi:class I SAM-dependent methyltransferase [Bradyrhizobium guangdongense]|uniref:Class I SAM-dependent methyltransferase n=1 Tax=Bradyrhizobium guangdongense TaxID=1325090 RepID=A0A410V484_9BRAD|nr:class I SAM-dependent methyltransferase [Bradyrhizobium guangdongense]QAU38484.1 class I SAM-dependent methyltransferase [Bradyrhizobium guangdongense]QOZ59543.1 class I SAM-dependent methyltransferase [Bradyrhizobium guangdongense]GGI33767.1 hypothetical protein GCM10010987_76020 [Bradyrhizobium guangdongense]